MAAPQHLVVFVNGERFPLMDDRRFHFGAYFPEGSTLYDLLQTPPAPIPTSSIDPGVTAYKLQPFARYMAAPPRPGLPAVALHGLPESTTPLQLGRFLEMCLDGAFIEECNVYRSKVSDAGCNTRGFAILQHPSHAQMLVDMQQLPWREGNCVVYIEPLDIPRPTVGPRRRFRDSHLLDPVITLTAPPKLSSTLQTLNRVNPQSAKELETKPTAYFVLLVEDDEPVLANWVQTDRCVCSAELAKGFQAKLDQGFPVHIVFAIRERKEVFGFGIFTGAQINADADSDGRNGTAMCDISWLQYGAAVKKPEVDSCVSADVSTDVPSGAEIRPDWGFDICAAVDRALGRSTVRAAPQAPSVQPALVFKAPQQPSVMDGAVGGTGSHYADAGGNAQHGGYGGPSGHAPPYGSHQMNGGGAGYDQPPPPPPPPHDFGGPPQYGAANGRYGGEWEGPEGQGGYHGGGGYGRGGGGYGGGGYGGYGGRGGGFRGGRGMYR